MTDEFLKDAMGDARRVVIIGGPNGAGKTTIAKRILPEHFGINEFVNADLIAQGLSVLDPDRATVAAGRIMLTRLRGLAESGVSFAFETTLASRSFAPWPSAISQQGYQIHLVVVWVDSVELSIGRVHRRAELGGHFVAEKRLSGDGTMPVSGTSLACIGPWRQHGVS